MAIIEGNLWHLTLAGRFGDYPPRDEAGFFALRSLQTPKLYELIRNAERTRHNHAPLSYQRKTALRAVAHGFMVLGDTIASFNPVYGHGMSSAALQAEALGKLLKDRAAQARGLEGLALAFFPNAAEVVADSWVLAGNVDLAYAKTQGQIPEEVLFARRPAPCISSQSQPLSPQT